MDAEGAGVAEGIGEVDGEDGGSCEACGGEGAVEEDRTEGDVGEVGAEAGAGHPEFGADHAAVEEDGGPSEECEARDHDEVGAAEGDAVVFDEEEDAEDEEDDEGDGAFGAGEGGGVCDAEFEEEVGLVVVTVVAVCC